MNLPKRLENAITALQKAYLKNELAALDCAACACGNIVAHANGIQVIRMNTHSIARYYEWSHGNNVNWSDWTIGRSDPDDHTLNAGYNAHELTQIESVFMTKAESHGDNSWGAMEATIKLLFELDGLDYDDYSQEVAPKFDRELETAE